MGDSVPQPRQARERDEAERSAIEAALTSDSSLRTDDHNIGRYLYVTKTTAYPLEYAHALVGDVSGQRVLDLGCGSGENSLLLARRAPASPAWTSPPRCSRSRVVVSPSTAWQTARASSLARRTRCPSATGRSILVFGVAVLHHLELDAAAAEVWRVLGPGGRAIFQEPVRDSALVRTLRRLVPFRAPDVSPHERPLTTAEAARSGRRFSQLETRAFWLPFVNVIHAIPAVYRLIHRAHAFDAALLRRFPALEPLAGLRVIEVRK